ncbi:hypothetical protein HK405_012040, partial [Cladochytrium tenue]
LWRVLRRCALHDHVSRQPHGLDAPVTEGGENLSAGQRQLLCLGRALLRDARILVVDEATASVDPDTDRLVQHVLRSDFAGRTVLCIAHRLSTLADYDRILVLADGQVVEFDSPRALLLKPGSAFAAMVDETGAQAPALRALILGHDGAKSP